MFARKPRLLTFNLILTLQLCSPKTLTQVFCVTWDFYSRLDCCQRGGHHETFRNYWTNFRELNRVLSGPEALEPTVSVPLLLSFDSVSSPANYSSRLLEMRDLPRDTTHNLSLLSRAEA